MARTAEALVEPRLLIWARESIGLDVERAAKKIGIAADRLLEWESGNARPSIAQLRKAATAYKRPLAVFYLPEPPVDYQVLSDYRRLPASKVGKLSPELHAAIRHARWQREVAMELRLLESGPVQAAPRLDEHTVRNPEAVADKARKLLALSVEQQWAWKTPGEALGGWIAAMNDLDVLVQHVQSIPVEEMRGFSVTESEMPVIVLNGGDYPRARIFTLLHEFAHLLLNAAGVCDLHDRKRSETGDDLEVFCNQVAASILMPSAVFRAEQLLQEPPSEGRWSDRDLERLSERYSVSQEAVLRRLYELELTTWAFLREKQTEFRAAYAERRREAEERRKAGERTGPSWYRMHVRDLGRAYLRLALDAYHRDDINASELSDFAEIKLNNLPGLEEELAGRGMA
jgi:Zn-dependent peptidase ImmA (M78 family)